MKENSKAGEKFLIHLKLQKREWCGAAGFNFMNFVFPSSRWEKKKNVQNSSFAMPLKVKKNKGAG